VTGRHSSRTLIHYPPKDYLIKRSHHFRLTKFEMSSGDHILEWRAKAPWPQDIQVEQDLVIGRALVEIFSYPFLHDRLTKRAMAPAPP
jgi:hypothetical protein